MTTLAELRASVSADIRDPLNAIFTSTQVDALINAGMAEVSRVFPQEKVESVAPIALTYAYATQVDQAFRVEKFRATVFQSLIPANTDESSQGGWELFGGFLYLPKAVVDASTPATDSFKVWGYQPRAQLTTDAQVADLDTQAEWGVRAYARWMAYQSMLAERALFKQFQAQSQNTDISAAQLEQMVTIYSHEWSNQRNHLRRLRRA